MKEQDEMKAIYTYEWVKVLADERDPKAGGASHLYELEDVESGRPFGTVQFQHGPRAEPGSTRGALDDSLLAVAQDRLEAFQAGPFAHETNAEALEHIKAARAVLRKRAEERRARGVLGKNVA